MNAIEARALMNGSVLQSVESPAPGKEVFLPLYLEQIRGLGLTVEGTKTLPPRLADVMAQRLQGLDVAERLVLQCASVLGNRCSRIILEEIAGEDNMPAIETLAKRGLLAIEDDEIEIVHPFIRDLVEAFIPSQARKELHSRAFALMTEREGVPLEVRGVVKEIKGRKVVVSATLSANGQVCARGEVVAVQMPENLLPSV
jgi:hypothetical protein